jgi:hypothetical protein
MFEMYIFGKNLVFEESLQEEHFTKFFLSLNAEEV